MTEPSPPRRAAFAERPLVRTLRDPVYAVYATGHFMSQLGSWIQQIAVAWLAWTLTESEAWLGVVAFCQFVPAMFLGPLSGAVADRYDRLTVSAWGQVLSGSVGIGLYAMSAAGMLTIVPLIVGVLLFGTISTFSLPSMRALVSELVPGDRLSTAISVSSITVNIARFTGPMIAAALIHIGHLDLCFLANGLSFFIFLAALAFVRRRRLARPAARSGEARQGMMAAMRHGFSYSAANPTIRIAFLAYLAYSALARPAIDLLPAIVGSLFQAGSETLAMMTSAFGLAAIVAGFAMAGVSSAAGLWRMMAVSLVALAIGLAGLVSTNSTAVALGFIAVFGAGQVIANITTQTLSQWFAHDELRGRVTALHFMIFRTGAALGALVMGALAELFGLRVVFLTAAAIIMLAAIDVARRKLSGTAPE